VIVSREPDGLCVVLQVDHQTQCAAAAAQWGNDAFDRLDHWGAVVTAVAIHDAGWAAWEAAPRIDGEGKPIDFPDLDRAEHTDLARAGVAGAFALGPRVGLLVSMHCDGLYRARLGLDGAPRPTAELPTPVQAFIADQVEVQHVAKAEIGDGEEVEAWAWSAYRLIQAWDALSLFLCWRGLPDGRERRLPAVPRTLGDDGVDLRLRPLDARTGACSPFPFAGDEAHLAVTARVIPDRVYRSDEDLQAALRDATPEVRDYRVVPG
jgi:Protein of unknown function (DUF3891)